VQALPSVQLAPFGFAGFEQRPVAPSQVPALWHWSLAAQLVGAPALQVPLWHVSPTVQASPSVQVAPFGFAGFEQTPVAPSHVPARWHVSEAVHVTGFAPRQTPPWHVSVRVHSLESLHAAPFALGGFEQTPVPGLQLPAS
jgi:tRNA U34 5-methylaminomethyl-2-thiouridine-forming methyltransferase MnmC